MADQLVLQPLPRRNRQWTFRILLVLFVVSLPFLYLYATGYRFEFGEQTNLISTGGMYVAAERTGAEIYIDDELVRETRVFRRAFYAQSLEPGTHKVHVQKEGHHTWVKELPVLPHLVTEAQAFNLPIVPEVRVIAPWQTATGSAVVRAFTLHASTSNEYVATTTKVTTQFVANTEYVTLLALFASTTATTTESLTDRVVRQIDSLLSTSTATSSENDTKKAKEWQGVRLYEEDGDVYATWTGSKEGMPYYYCAEEFPQYSSTTPASVIFDKADLQKLPANVSEGDELLHPVQTLPADAACDPTIKIDRQSETVKSFDFYPGSTDLVIMVLEDGIYVVEVDDRGWQNVQPLLLGEDLDMSIENGQIYVYDGDLIYQIILTA